MPADLRPRTPLTPAQLAEVDRLAAEHRWSRSRTLAVLVEEAIGQRKRSPFDPAKVEQLRSNVRELGLTMFGGRRRGQACECGNGTLEATRHEGVAFTGWTIDCTACAAGYDEQGRHYCPVCEEYRDGWQGGTDAAPRPWCSKCGNPQPGWKEVPSV